MKKTTSEFSYARMGMAAMLPGMQRAAELLLAEVEKFKALLSDEDATGPQIANAVRAKNSSRTQANWWAKLSPEERRKEMKRRGMVREVGKNSPLRKLTPAKLEEKRRKDREAKRRRYAEAKAARLAS